MAKKYTRNTNKSGTTKQKQESPFEGVGGMLNAQPYKIAISSRFGPSDTIFTGTPTSRSTSRT